MVRLLAAPGALIAAYLVLYFFFVENVYVHAKLFYPLSPVTTWHSRILKWLDRTLNPLLENNLIAYLPSISAGGLHGLMNWIGREHIVALVAIALALLFAIIRRRMLPMFALGMTLVTLIPYAAMRYTYFSGRYNYGVMLGSMLLAVALGAEAWHLTKDKRKGLWSLIRISIACLVGVAGAASLGQLCLSVSHDRSATQAPRALYDVLAAQSDKADRYALFLVDTHEVDHLVDVELGWGLFECARLALDSETVGAVQLGFDLNQQPLADFGTYNEKYLIVAGEKGWTVEPMPDTIRLTIARGTYIGVFLERRR
jgi:hypothetical protein